MEEEKKKGKPKSLTRRILKWVSGIVILVGLLWASYILLGVYLKKNLGKTVEERSEGIYSISFEKFEMLGLEMGFRLTGFELEPNLDLYLEKKKRGEVKTSLYRVIVPKAELKGLNVLDLLLSPGLELDELHFFKPKVQILAHIDSVQNQEAKEYDDVGPIIRNLMEFLLIDRIRIDEGEFDLFEDKEDRIESFTASKLSLDLKGFKVDNTQGIGSKKFLYSESYEIGLKDYKLYLTDGVHTIEANEISFSSQDSSVVARGFNLSPGQQHPDSLFLLTNPYYHFFFPELRIKGADIQSAYQTDSLNIRMIHLQMPNFQIFNIRDEKKKVEKKEFTGFAQNIYPLIEGYFNEVKIDSVLIGNGTFDFYEPFELHPENIEIEGINVALEGFYLDSSAYLDDDNLLYAKEFWLDFETFRMDLRDSLHEIAADSLFISSKLQAIRAQGLILRPKTEVNRRMNYVDLSIPNILIDGIDLIKAYHKRILGAKLFDLRSPVIKANIGKPRKSRSRVGNEKGPDIVEVVSRYFDTVSVNNIKLENGIVDFWFLQKGRMESIRGDQINLDLFGFELDSLASRRKNRIFFSRHLELEIHDYDFLLDKLHEVKIKKMSLSTRRKKVDFQDIIFAPRDTSNVVAELKKQGLTTLFDIYIPGLKWEGLDIYKLVYQDALIAKRIHLLNPEFGFTLYPNRSSKKELKPILEEDFQKLITKLIRKISVGEYYAENALVRVSQEPHRENQFWTRAPVDLRLLGFEVDEKVKKIDPDRFFFSEDLQVILKDYDLDFGGPAHNLFAEKITLSSKDKKLEGIGIKVTPKKFKGNIFPFKVKLNATFPKLLATGIDLKRLFEEKVLIIDEIITENPNFQYHQAKTFFGQKTGQGGQKGKGLNGLVINRIKTKKGTVSIHNEYGNKLFQTNFEGPVRNLVINEYSTGASPSMFLTRQIGLNFTDGFVLLGDGLHRFEWEKFKVDQQGSRITLLDGKLVAMPGSNPFRTLSRTQKSAYRSGSVKKLEITGFDVDDFYQSGDIEIERVRVSDVGLIEFIFPQLRKKTKLDLSNIQINFPKGINSLEIETIDLTNFHFFRYNVLGDSLDLVLDQGKIYGKIRGVKIRNGERWNDDRIGFADDITLVVRNFSRKLPEAMMDLTAKEVGVSTGRKEAFVYDFHIKPWYGKYLHSRKLGFETDRIEIKLDKIFLKDFDLIRLYHDQYLRGQKLVVDGMLVNDHRDKRMPDRENFFPPMPQEILKQIDFRFHLDTVSVSNGEIQYEEFVEGGKVPGIVDFKDFSATAVNVTSDPEIFRQDPLLKMSGTAKLMGEGVIDFHCNLNIRDPGNKFEMWGSVGPMDMRKINPMVENVAFTTIKSGYIKSIEFDAKADDHYSTGNMEFKYSDFKIALINKNTGQVEGLDKGFISFLANTFVVNTRNPHLGFFREGSIFFKRNPNKSIINYWWKSLYTGIKTSIGAQNERKLHKIAEKSGKKE